MRFTIRDLLWLTVVVALGAGWARERQRVAELEDEARAELISRNLTVEDDAVPNPSAPDQNPPKD